MLHDKPSGEAHSLAFTFASAETRERALVYLGAPGTSKSKITCSQCVPEGQGSTHIRLLPNRKNLLRVDYGKL
jgi:hypothetical protein